MSDATETALWDAITDHMRDEGILEGDELLVAWIMPYCAELPSKPNAARYGHVQPDRQRYHVSHGLVAGLFAAFNAGVGEVSHEDGDEGL